MVFSAESEDSSDGRPIVLRPGQNTTVTGGTAPPAPMRGPVRSSEIDVIVLGLTAEGTPSAEGLRRLAEAHALGYRITAVGGDARSQIIYVERSFRPQSGQAIRLPQALEADAAAAKEFRLGLMRQMAAAQAAESVPASENPER